MILSPEVFWFFLFFWRVARGEKGGGGAHTTSFMYVHVKVVCLYCGCFHGVVGLFSIVKSYMLSSFIFLKKEKS